VNDTRELKTPKGGERRKYTKGKIWKKKKEKKKKTTQKPGGVSLSANIR